MECHVLLITRSQQIPSYSTLYNHQDNDTELNDSKKTSFRRGQTVEDEVVDDIRLERDLFNQ